MRLVVDFKYLFLTWIQFVTCIYFLLLFFSNKRFFFFLSFVVGVCVWFFFSKFNFFLLFWKNNNNREENSACVFSPRRSVRYCVRTRLYATKWFQFFSPLHLTVNEERNGSERPTVRTVKLSQIAHTKHHKLNIHPVSKEAFYVGVVVCSTKLFSSASNVYVHCTCVTYSNVPYVVSTYTHSLSCTHLLWDIQSENDPLLLVFTRVEISLSHTHSHTISPNCVRPPAMRPRT